MALFKVSDGTNFIYDRTDTYTKELKNVSDYWHHLDDSRKMGVKGEYYGIRGYSSLKKKLEQIMEPTPISLLSFCLVIQ